MRFKRKRLPEIGEIVVCTVKKLTPYSAFVDLDEFENLEGMIHITEVSSRIVRNIKEHLEIGQKVIAKVIRVKPKEKIIDLSIKRVKKFEQKRKTEEIRKEKRAEKLLELFCEREGLDVNEFFEKHFRSIKEEGYLFHAFEQALLEGVKVLNRKYKIKKELAEKLLEMIKKEFSKPYTEIRLRIEAISWEGDGIKRIREFFKKLKEILKDYRPEIIYEGAPKYLAILKVQNPKEFQKKFESIKEEIGKIASKLKVESKIEKVKK